MDRIYKIGISSFAYSFARGSRPFQRPEHILTPFDLMNLHPHAVLVRVLWRWYQSPFGS